MLRVAKCATCGWTLRLIPRTTVRVCPRCDLSALIPSMAGYYADPPVIRPEAPDDGTTTERSGSL